MEHHLHLLGTLMDLPVQDQQAHLHPSHMEPQVQDLPVPLQEIHMELPQHLPVILTERQALALLVHPLVNHMEHQLPVHLPEIHMVVQVLKL
jgi:hypothetical protein